MPNIGSCIGERKMAFAISSGLGLKLSLNSGPMRRMTNQNEHEPASSPEAAPSYAADSPWSPSTALLLTIAIILASIAGAVAAVTGVDRLGLSAHDRAMVLMAVNQIIMITLTVLAAQARGADIKAVLALRPLQRGLLDVALGLLLILAVLAAVNLVAVLLLGHDPLADMRQFASIFKGPHWFLALLVVGVGAPLSEELLFRGFLQSSLTRAPLGFAGGAVIATVIWTSLHAGYSVVGMTEVALIGALLSFLLWRTGSLWVCIMCHGLYNSGLALYSRFLMT